MKNLITSLIAILLLSSIVMATGTITRTAQSTVSPSSTFTVTYTASGVSGDWGGIITDNVAGGCTFPAGTQYKNAMLSMAGTTQTVQVTAPSSGTCTFTGYFQFADDTSNTPFPSKTITIGTTCTPSCTGRACGLDPICGTLNCGTCTSPQTCNANGQCVSSCTDTCLSLGKQCGTQTICGSSINCGTCQTGYTCSNGQCVSSSCTSGQTESCTASNTCTGTRTCTSGAWGACTTTLQKCTDGKCLATCPTPVGFCLEFANNLLSPYTNINDCQQNTILFIIILVVGVALIGKLMG